jgi:hypothetical protein
VDIATLAGALVDLAEVLALANREDETGPPLREALQLYVRKEDAVSVVRVRGLLGEPAQVREGPTAPASISPGMGR